MTGASSGIGRAMALGLARRGHDLILVARRQNLLEELADEIERTSGRSADVIAADLTDPGQLDKVAARLADPGRPVEVLVNGAGLGAEGSFVDLPVSGEERQVQLNVIATVRLCGAALPAMVERGRGEVVNVSSLASLQPIPRWATYSATKAFVTTFTRAVAAEMDGTGVHLMVLLPGLTVTEFHETARFDGGRIPGPAWMTAEEVAEQALDDLDRGRRESIPGFQNRALAVLSRLSPWPLTRAVLKWATRRGAENDG